MFLWFLNFTFNLGLFQRIHKIKFHIIAATIINNKNHLILIIEVSQIRLYYSYYHICICCVTIN